MIKSTDKICFLGDSLHPNAKGHALIARAILNKV